MPFVGCTLKFPHSISLSSLRISSLRYVTFMDDGSTSTRPSSLSLEELLIRSCSLKNLKLICIAAPNICHMAVLSNVCRLQIQGVNLRRFSYSGHLLDEYSFVDSSIESSQIYMIHADNAVSDVVVKHEYNLLSGLLDVQCLGLSVGFLQVNLPITFPINCAVVLCVPK